MIRFFAFWVVILLSFYMAVIYTSEAMLLFVFTTAILLFCSFVYLLAARIFILGKVDIPIPVTDVSQPLTIQVKINNKSFLPVFRMKLALKVTNSFEKQVSVIWQKTSVLLSGENLAEFSLTLEQGGHYSVCLEKIRIYDLIGLCYITKHFSSEKSVQVLPNLTEIPILLTPRITNYYGDSDIYDTQKSGHDSSEIFQIRSYLAGDRPQSIHWKLSAKNDELMVKEHALPKPCPVILFLDYCPDKKKKSGIFGTFLKIGASLSFSLMETGCSHYVVWYEADSDEIVRMRIDDEESFYLFLNIYLSGNGNTGSGHLILLYNEKYKAERYLYSLRLTESLTLYQNEQKLFQLKPNISEEQLGGLEIVL